MRKKRESRVWQISNGVETYAGYGDDPVALVRALLAETVDSEEPAASIDIHVGFYDTYEATMTVTR